MKEVDASSIKFVAVLTYVLGYDDLLADTSRAWPIESGAFPLAIGRAGENEPPGFRSRSELILSDQWMSGKHAVLRRRGAADILEDTGSRNGTYLNGEALVGEKALSDGDLIEVGHSLLCYRLLPESETDGLFDLASPPRLGPTVTRSPEVVALVRALARIATTRSSVLLLGETGAGKEIAARALHDGSRRSGAFHALNCGAIPEQLFESTFFGHTKGAFTGATEAREGEVALCDEGTLFLDEVATMSTTSQAKLLRVLENGEVTRVGSSTPRRYDVRWVAATNVDLLEDCGTFREDLLRRLAGYVGRIPPLRRRREDLGVLSAHVLREGGVQRASITATAARAFFTGSFPGNIRDLRLLRSAAWLAGEGVIDQQHLPALGHTTTARPQPPAASARAPTPSGGAPSRRSRSAPDIATIEAALVSTSGNVVHAAEMLGTHPRQLYRWIEKRSVSLDRFRR